jgi:hypothetical protein
MARTLARKAGFVGSLVRPPAMIPHLEKIHDKEGEPRVTFDRDDR